jgi:hypothetical protein
VASLLPRRELRKLRAVEDELTPAQIDRLDSYPGGALADRAGASFWSAAALGSALAGLEHVLTGDKHATLFLFDFIPCWAGVFGATWMAHGTPLKRILGNGPIPGTPEMWVPRYEFQIETVYPGRVEEGVNKDAIRNGAKLRASIVQAAWQASGAPSRTVLEATLDLAGHRHLLAHHAAEAPFSELLTLWRSRVEGPYKALTERLNDRPLGLRVMTAETTEPLTQSLSQEDLASCTPDTPNVAIWLEERRIQRRREPNAMDWRRSLSDEVRRLFSDLPAIWTPTLADVEVAKTRLVVHPEAQFAIAVEHATTLAQRVEEQRADVQQTASVPADRPVVTSTQSPSIAPAGRMSAQTLVESVDRVSAGLRDAVGEPRAL